MTVSKFFRGQHVDSVTKLNTSNGLNTTFLTHSLIGEYKMVLTLLLIYNQDTMRENTINIQRTDSGHVADTGAFSFL